QDLAVADSDSDNVSILLGDGTGNFSAATNFAVVNPTSVAVGDFNSDGNQDLAVAAEGPNNASILLGNGTGSFSAPTNFTVGFFPTSVAVGDFNGDGKQDLAVVNESSDNVSILLRVCPVSQITPAATTCSQFSSGTAQTLGSVQYDRNNGLINRVNPRALLYWVMVTAPAGNNTFRITQTITTGNFSSFFAVNGNGSNVFDSDCVRLQRGITQSGDAVTVRFNAPSAGTYFIAIKYNSQSLSGEPVPSPGTTVHYDFMRSGVPASTRGLDLVRY
ncbi:MAG: VCBS repeat-containing protein, partial [Chthoniobacterales bacterium]